MALEEELMREIIEMLKGFTIVVAVMLAFMFLIFVVLAFYVLVNEKKVEKDFIEVKDQYQNKKILLPVNRICFIRERSDGCAVINFEMSVTDRECTALIT